MKIKVKKKLKFVPALFKFQDNVKSLQARVLLCTKYFLYINKTEIELRYSSKHFKNARCVICL